MKRTIINSTIATMILGPALAHSMLYMEDLHEGWGQHFVVDRVIHSETTNFQDLILFENSRWGLVLSLDNIVQLTTKDEYIYHEMIAHVPLLSHSNPERVLIIGGGDGGTLREVVKHSYLQTIDLVDIDPRVIEVSKQFLPTVSNGAYNDPRVSVIIGDGYEYLQNHSEQYDVIICDTTDEIGPGESLFTKEFYTALKKALRPNGIMINMDSVPELNPEYLHKNYSKRKDLFQYVNFYFASVPTYVGGPLALGFTSDYPYLQELDPKALAAKMESIGLKTKYYNPEVHEAAFVKPNTLKEVLK